MKRNCGDCDFYCEVWPSGQCRKNPPTFDPEYNTEDNFPPVLKTSWCGEFKPRKADKDETKS